MTRRHLPTLALLFALASFLAVGLWLADRLPVWHEIVSSLPNHGAEVMLTPPLHAAAIASSCSDPEPPRFVISPVRPLLSLCVAGETLPIMVSAYASGIAAWPLALFHGWIHDDTFAFRRLWLGVAAFSLVMMFRLVRRLADGTTAALVAVMTATSAPFLMVNALLVPFETVPCTLVVLALSVLSTCPELAPGARDAPSRPWRLVLAAMLTGFALATNVKAIFLIAPVAILAARSGVRRRGLSLRLGAGMALAFTLPLVPLVTFALIDPRHGFQGQVRFRVLNLLGNLRIAHLLREPVLLLNFASDTFSLMDMASHRAPVHIGLLTLVVAIPLLACVLAAVTHLVGSPRGSLVSATVGAIIVTYFLVSMLLYGQYPGGNYAPLHEVFGIAVAVGTVDLARFLSAKLGARVPAAMLASVGVGALALASLFTIASHGDPSKEMDLSMNSVAERAAAAYLVENAAGSAPLLTTTYNLAGVFAALGHGRLRPIDVHENLERCDRAVSMDDCVAQRWRWILLHAGSTPLRVLLPSRAAAVDKPVAVVLALSRALMVATHELGLTAELERSFLTGGGVAALDLYKIQGIVRAGSQDESPEVPEDAACEGRIDAQAAQALFDSLKGTSADECTLAGVDTQGNAMHITWSKGGRPTDSALVVPRACAGDGAVRGQNLAVTVPPAARVVCPDAARRLTDAVAPLGDVPAWRQWWP